MFNRVGRNIPVEIFGLGALPLFDSNELVKNTQRSKDRFKNSERNKILDSIETAIRETGLKDGMMISFHHHFRNGDYIINMVLNAISRMGIKDLVLAPSSLSGIHAPLINHIKSGVIRRIETSGLRGELADAISNGLMDIPIVINSHGGRARAIASGELPIDVAF